MSRIESGKIELENEASDLCAVFEDIHDLFAQQMEAKQIDFSVCTAEVEHRYAWCDRKNLNRVLLNLLSNAYKFTPEGGRITASICEKGPAEQSFSAYEIRIQDSGIGMSKEFSEKMFTAFERERTSTASKIEGTGLGLAITKNIIDLMDGTIEVNTSPGSGTEIIIRFRFQLAGQEDLPLKEAETETSLQEESIDFSGKRLLLVEDNEINREIATMILTQMGFLVECAEDGQIAVDRISASEPGYYDLILMDIQMPVMNGLDATRAIRTLDNKALAEIPIVAMTANAFKEDEQAAEEAGMQGHIAKPLDIDDDKDPLAGAEVKKGKNNRGRFSKRTAPRLFSSPGKVI